MPNKITVIDYGVGNLFSVGRALEHCGANIEITSDPNAVRSAHKVLLPGVGAFADGMQRLTQHGMDAAIKEAASRGAFVLGVCLGMQLLLDTSEEFGLTTGLGLIPGKVVPIPVRTTNGVPLKIPHIGWNELKPSHALQDWRGTLLETIPMESSMYFVHSFMAEPLNPLHRLADVIYGDLKIAAVIGNGNVWGAQFHPEKSGESGLAILRQFVRLS